MKDKDEKMTMMTSRIPADLLKAAKMQCVKEGITLQAWISKIMYENIE